MTVGIAISNLHKKNPDWNNVSRNSIYFLVLEELRQKTEREEQERREKEKNEAEEKRRLENEVRQSGFI